MLIWARLLGQFFNEGRADRWKVCTYRREALTRPIQRSRGNSEVFEETLIVPPKKLKNFMKLHRHVRLVRSSNLVTDTDSWCSLHTGNVTIGFICPYPFIFERHSLLRRRERRDSV